MSEVGIKLFRPFILGAAICDLIACSHFTIGTDIYRVKRSSNISPLDKGIAPRPTAVLARESV